MSLPTCLCGQPLVASSSWVADSCLLGISTNEPHFSNLRSSSDTLGASGIVGKFMHCKTDQGLALQAWTEAQLQKDLGLTSDMSTSVWAWCRGQCDEAVAEKGPPKTLSVQISLTPVPLTMHPSQGGQVSAAGGKPGEL